MLCPLCNWEVVRGRCTNTVSHCDYKGAGVPPTVLTPDMRLGDMTGEPRNNGDYGSQNYSDKED